MKSAYDKALERLEKSHGPSKKLTDEQREALAEIDKRYDARIAETRLNAETQLASASPQDRPAINEHVLSEVASLEEKREREKQAVWDQKA
jgi:hypothetical protein